MTLLMFFRTLQFNFMFDSNSFFSGHSNLDPNSEYSKRIFGVRTSTQYMRGIVTKLRLLSATEAYWIEDRLGSFKQYGQPGDLEFMDQYFKLGSRFRYCVIIL